MNFQFRGKRSLSLRLWHWLNAVTILALLTTVFLRSRLVGVRENAKRISDRIGPAVSTEQAKDVARMYRDRLWEWHVELGLILAGLLLLRVFTELFAASGTGLFSKIKNSVAAAKTDQFAHIIGVVRAEKTTDPGLVSDMIHGG